MAQYLLLSEYHKTIFLCIQIKIASLCSNEQANRTPTPVSTLPRLSSWMPQDKNPFVLYQVRYTNTNKRKTFKDWSFIPIPNAE